MKRNGLVVSLVVIVVFCASSSFAQDIITRNRNNNTATATGGAAWQQQQQQQLNQQRQVQDQTMNTPLQAPLMGVGVGPGGAEVGKEVMLSCNPFYQWFSMDELKSMSNSGRFLDKRGSFFDAISGEKIKEKIRARKATASKDGIQILNQVPANTKVLGQFSCTGDYGWGLDEVLSKCLLAAREKTNTSNVVVFQINDIDATNSGTAVGAGVGMSNPFKDDSVGAGAVAASFGKTHSFKERIVLLEVYALDDVIEASNVCGGQQVILAPATQLQPVAQQAKACDPQSIYIALEKNRIAIYGDGGSKKGCEDYCLNNLRLRAERGKLFYDLYKCTGDMEALKAAKDNYAIAARNYKFGSDIKKNQAEADKLIDQVYEAWSEIGGK